MDKFKRCNETLFHNVRPPTPTLIPYTPALFHNVRPPTRKAGINPITPALIP